MTLPRKLLPGEIREEIMAKVAHALASSLDPDEEVVEK